MKQYQADGGYRDDTNVVELQDKIKSLTSDLEFEKKIFNQVMNGDTTTDDSSEGGGCGDGVDKKAERLRELTANMNSFAEKYQVIQSGISQATGLASLRYLLRLSLINSWKSLKLGILSDRASVLAALIFSPCSLKALCSSINLYIVTGKQIGRAHV